MPAIVGSVFFLCTLAISFNMGSFVGDTAPIVILSLAFLILLISLYKPKFVGNKITLADLSPILLLATYSLSLFFERLWWGQQPAIQSQINTLSQLMLFPLLFFVIGKHLNKSFHFFLYIVFLTVAIILRLYVLSGSPAPAIDVIVLIKEGAQKVMSLTNPYNSTYTQVFPAVTPNYNVYWPATFILHLPFVAIFHDPRVTHITVEIITAILLFIIGGKTLTAQMLSLIFLFRPQSLFIIESSWLTPLNFFFVTLIFFILNRDQKGQNKNTPLIVGILLGILTSIQFFHGIIFFYLLKYFSGGKKFIFSFFITVAVFVIPFFLINPLNFIDQTLLFYFKNPPPPAVLIHTSLNLNSVFFHYFRQDIPGIILYAFIIFFFIFTLKRTTKNIQSLIFNLTLFFFAAFLFGRQSFINYYYFVASMLLLCLVITAKDLNK